MTAEIAFDSEPVYERWAQGQARTFATMEQALLTQDASESRTRAGLSVSESNHPSSEFLPAV